MKKLPKTICGIETDKHATKQRRGIIKSTYLKLCEKLPKDKGGRFIYNDFLCANVFIVMRESFKKASNSAANNWESTYAILHIEDVIKNAKGENNVPIYSAPKEGTQQKLGYINMATLYYKFKSTKYDYMNFTVKLVLGIKTNGNHIQYSINKIDVIK